MSNLNCLSQYKYPRRIKIETKVPLREYGKDSPGPKYNPVDTQLTKHARSMSVSFTAGSRDDNTGMRRQVSVPGPGAYAQPSAIQTGRGFSFGASTRLLKPRDLAPGPGKYDLGTTLVNKPLTLAGAPKGEGAVSKVPGPGAYAPNWSQLEKTAPKMSFTAGSFAKDKDNGVPGPGKYEQMSTLNGNCVMKRSSVPTITGASVELKKDTTPGFIAQPTTFKIP